MESIIEFVINVKQDEFNQWLESYLPGEGRNIIYLLDDWEPAILEFDKEESSFQSHVCKISFPLQRIRTISNVCHYKIPVQIGKLSTIDNCQYHDILVLSTFKIDDNSTLVKLDFAEMELRPYLLDLIARIMLAWPESKRKLIREIPSPYERKKDNVLFEMSVDADPDEFFDWLNEVIGDNPTRRFLDIINNIKYETLIHGSEVFSPCSDMNYWEFLILASTKITKRDESSLDNVFIENINNWNIARIELRVAHEECLHLICYADYEGFDGWICELENKIMLAFPCTNLEELKRQREKYQPDPVSERPRKPIIDDEPSNVRVPTRRAVYLKWKAIWNEVKDKWLSTGDIVACDLILSSSELPRQSLDILRDIITAGEKGMLDKNQ